MGDQTLGRHLSDFGSASSFALRTKSWITPQELASLERFFESLIDRVIAKSPVEAGIVAASRLVEYIRSRSEGVPSCTSRSPHSIPKPHECALCNPTSSAFRSHPTQSAAAAYVVSKNCISAASGSGDWRIAS